MSDLGQTIREIQREAAALPTAALRHEIQMNLEVQDAAIRQLASIRPGTRPRRICSSRPARSGTPC